MSTTIEVTRSGLRKRLGHGRAGLTTTEKPLTLTPDSPVSVSELRVRRAENGEDADDEHAYGEGERINVSEEHGDVVNENMLQSFSSISSEDDSEREHESDLNRERGENQGRGIEEAGTGVASSNIRKTKNPPRVIRRGTSAAATIRRKKSRDVSSSSSSGSWLGYDLSIIVALVSPIGNILTGSDHIKNILLLLFLIYYLHQLVEVPWTLYRMSIPSEDSFSSIEDTADAAKLVAFAELQKLELFYLTLTVLSPFIGATLLKYVATAISGNPASLSWFSTLLFVLATGIRPWMHLIERLKNRSRALKELVEESGTDDDGASGNEDEEDPHAKIDREIVELRGKYDAVDKRLTDMDVTSSRELDDLSEAMDAVEASIRKYQTDAKKKETEWDKRLSVLETYVLDLHQKDRSTRIHEKHEKDSTYMRGARLRTLFWEALALPWTVSAFTWDVVPMTLRRLIGGRARDIPARVVLEKHIPPASNAGVGLGFRSHVLETIVEEDVAEPEQSTGNPDRDLINMRDTRGNGVNGGAIGESDSSQTLVSENGDVAKKRRDVLVELGVSMIFRVLTIVFAPAILLVRVLSTFFELPRSAMHTVTH